MEFARTAKDSCSQGQPLGRLQLRAQAATSCGPPKIESSNAADASTRWHLGAFVSGFSATIASVRILQRCPHDLGRVDDAGPHQILELAGLRLEAPVVLVLIE